MHIVSPEIPSQNTILKNFFRVIGVYGGIWIIFHLVSVFFFGFIVGSPLLVGIFLGIGNIWSMMIDVPLGNIQRQVKSKTMLAIANGCMIIAATIFLYLIRKNTDISLDLDGNIVSITKDFLGNIINFILLLVVGILYGTIKEVYDITTISYLLNHSDPSQYDTGLSRMSIASGSGSVVGILLSIALLSLRTDSVQLIVFVLIFLIICVWVFIATYFDNDHETFHFSDIKNLHIVEKVKDVEKIHFLS